MKRIRFWRFFKLLWKTNVDKNFNWFIGASLDGLGNTNNGIEGFNNAIKEHFLGRTRFDISYFFLLEFYLLLFF